MKLLLIFKLIIVSNYAVGDSTDSDDLRKKEPGFIFTYPKTLLAGKKETVCLVLHDATYPTKVMVDLKIREKHHVTTHVTDTEYSCFEIQVPEHKSKEPVGTSLHIQLQLNGSIHSGHNLETILMYPKKDATFVETDRSFYKPGEKVKIRALVLRHDLRPPHHNYTLPSVKIFNPVGTTVAVWEKVRTELGLAQFEFQLAEDTAVGKWKIEINDATRQFHVKRYVLPRFQVTLMHPKVIHNRVENASFSVCAKYSYGKMVKGIGLIKISYPDLILEPINRIKELKNGCVTFTFTNDELHLQRFNLNHRTIHIMGTVTEQGTNNIEIDSGKTRVTSSLYGLEFSEDQPYFQPGLPYRGKLKIVDPHIPIAEESAEICFNIAVKKAWNIKQQHCKNFTFDSDNTVHFNLLPMKENVILINLYARSLHRTETEISSSLTLHRWYSLSNNYIYIERSNKMAKCGQYVHFTVHYTSEKFKQHENVTFFYLLKSRNEILNMGKISHSPRRHNLNLDDLKNVLGVANRFTQAENKVDKFVLKFKLGSNVISKSQLVVYSILRQEVVAANVDVHVEKCLFNKVDAKWSNSQLYPGESATLTIQTAPDSLCAVSSVDKSSTFLSSTKPLNIHSVLTPFLQERSAKPSSKPNCLIYHRKRPENYTDDKFWELRRRKRYYGMLGSDDYDTFDVFNGVGIGVTSNLKFLMKQCVQRDFALRSTPVGMAYDVQHEDRGTSIRSFFPETWLWELVPVGKAGEASLNRYLPHTITDWITNTMCVSLTKGIGVSSTTELNAFKPFFIDILTPYSIKREEILHMTVLLFNYMNHSLPIRITLGDHPNIVLADRVDEKKKTLCVKAGDSSAHTYRIKGIKLGSFNVSVLAEIESSYPVECGPEVIVYKRDMVYKNILVEPEGYPNEIVKSSFLCSNDTLSANNVTWNLLLPQDVVPDSPMVKIAFNADLLGPTIQNLEGLLKVPTGCGEQIMATLAPNLYILRYLKSNNKLTPPMYQRAVRNLKIGYQRILDYVHPDGSFSAFGYHDSSGSMFLTAFVVRTLRQAKSYIFVDDKVISKAVNWITNNQLENGCFAAVSHVFQDMGGTSTENSTAALTAYVLISLLESDIQLSDTLRTNAKYCIRGHYQADKYTLAISTYALYLVDWHSEAARCLQRLVEAATRENGLMWWSHPGLSASINIEMTGYVLMSLLYRNSTENMVHASAIVRWLATQRGPQGGFSTTQDTAVALDAISRYAALVKSRDPELNITISSYSQTSYVHINPEDRLKTKQERLSEVPGKVKVTVAGDGCILVQAVVNYNLKHLSNSEAFKLAVDVESVSTIDQCSVAMISPCISYAGPGIHSNMAVLEVAMPSGYEADRASLYQLTSEINTKVKRFEELKNCVVLYFTKLNNELVCVPFNINENIMVENLVNTTIKLYDYYKPEMSITKSYKINTCLPNEISPIPPLPEHMVKSNISTSTKIDEVEVSAENATASDDPIDLTLPVTSNIRRRDVESNELNSNFVDMDVEMATPNGMEGNMPVYMKPDKNYTETSK